MTTANNNTSDVRERLKEVFALVFRLDKDAVGPDASTETIEGWDSLQHLTLILTIEEEFGVSVPLEESMEWSNFSTIETRVREKLGP